jgi:hypothetical protein
MSGALDDEGAEGACMRCRGMTDAQGGANLKQDANTATKLNQTNELLSFSNQLMTTCLTYVSDDDHVFMCLEINRIATDGDLSLVEPSTLVHFGPGIWLLVRATMRASPTRAPHAEEGSFRDSEISHSGAMKDFSSMIGSFTLLYI